MHTLSLSWTIGAGPGRVGGHKRAPAWSDIEEKVSHMRTQPGSVGLYIIEGPEAGPQSLQVFCEGGNYLLMLGELDEEHHFVRSYTNKHAKQDMVEIAGDLWDVRMVCYEFDIVMRAFREFFDRGDVSRELLD